MGYLDTRRNPFRKPFYALENIDAGDIVFAQPRYLIDDFQDYAADTAADDVWVESDAVNTGVFVGQTLLNSASGNNMGVQATTAQSNNDYIDKTISSTDYTGFVVNIIGLASAASTDWEFLMSSGANAVTSNVKKSLVFSAPNTLTHIQFTVAGMDVDNGSFNPAATLHFGFRCVDAGNPYIQLSMVYLTKAGEPTGAIRSVDGNYLGSTTDSTHLPIGVAEAAITAGNRGMVTMFGPTVPDNFTIPDDIELVPGWSYAAVNTSPGAITPYYGSDAGRLIDIHGNGFFGIGIAVSTTEMMLKAEAIIV